jgi:signal transduction histidine kinase
VSGSKTWGLVLAAVLLCGAGIYGSLRFRKPDFSGRVYRMGWGISPPYQVRGSGGKPAGLAVDLVREAARRRGIQLEWIFWQESSESALRSKRVDLWPLITVTPERLKAFHISQPYLENEYCLLVRGEAPFQRADDLATATVTLANVSIDAVQLRKRLPGAKYLSRQRIENVLDDVCDQRADAGFMDGYTAIAALLDRHGCGGRALRWIALPEIRSRLGVGSVFEARDAADALRTEIGAMAGEGKVGPILSQWGFMSGQRLESIEALLNARRREARLAAVTLLFGLLFVAACWQTLWLTRARNRARLAEQALRESQERYVQAQKLESIGRLAGGVAHDFNNLLTVINGYGDLLAMDLSADDPKRTAIDSICKAGARAAELTQQLLAFSRKQMIQPRAIDLNVVVSESQEMFRRLLGEDVELVARLSPRLGRVMADPGQIHQVLMNLVVNSRHAMPDGGRLVIETADVEVDAGYAAEHPGTLTGPHVVLTVTDSGAGMDEETRKHIFEPFFTTKGPNEGTGLGLATVYGIVKQSKGSIWVYSEPGRGTAFKIYLPRTAAVAAEAPVSDAAASQRRGSETVLVVEDQEDVRSLAAAMLRRYGYVVLEAADGADALALEAKHQGRIDVLLTDVVLPGINGRELAERLAAVRPALKVVFTSGYTQEVIAHRGVLDRGVHYIAKPYTPEGLATKVREVLEVG